MQLTSLSFAYPGVSASDRAGLFEPDASAEGLDVFVLATCLRVELAWPGTPDLAPTVVQKLFGHRTFPPAKTRTDLDAFHHLARVAAGLESPQVGEAEVLVQFRRALEHLAGRDSADGMLVRTLEAALGVARTARRSLSAPQDGSLAKAAARMVDNLQEVVVLGGGAMGRAVVRELGPSGVAVYSRRSEPVADVPSRPWEKLPEALASCQAVISTVPGPVPVLQEVRRSEGSPLMVIDLGMPPAMQPESSSVTYHGVDDVAASVPMTTEPEAEHLLALASEKAWGRLTVSSDASSLIASLVEIVDRAVDDEVLRFAGRFPPGIEESALRQMAHTLARRIIHPSVSLLGSSRLTPAELELLARALGVERD